MSFLDPLLGAIANGAEVTQLGAISYGAEVRTMLAQLGRCGADVVPSSAPRSMAPSSDYNHKVYLAQSVEHKALNLKVVGSSPTVDDVSIFITNLFFCCPDFFVYAVDLSV
jgi:hypothetical protein